MVKHKRKMFSYQTVCCLCQNYHGYLYFKTTDSEYHKAVKVLLQITDDLTFLTKKINHNPNSVDKAPCVQSRNHMNFFVLLWSTR